MFKYSRNNIQISNIWQNQQNQKPTVYSFIDFSFGLNVVLNYPEYLKI